MRVLQAPRETLPELAQFLEPFHVHFARSEGPAALERYLTGLLTEQPNKNCDTVAVHRCSSSVCIEVCARTIALANRRPLAFQATDLG